MLTRLGQFAEKLLSIAGVSAVTISENVSCDDLVVIECPYRLESQLLDTLKGDVEALLSSSGAKVLVLTEGAKVRIYRGAMRLDKTARETTT